MRPEHAGRQVCDGERVLADALSAAPPALVAPLAPQLAPLQRVLDTYGDLLVVDAVHALVSGRGDLAAPAMEAAAGLGPPPDMRALKTRRSGTAAATIVLAAIPDAAAPPGAGPAQLADPAFAARVAAELGVAATWTWRFREGRNPPVNVTLADAHLAGVDTVSLTDGAIATALRSAASATLAATLASTGGQERVDAARRLAAMLAGNDALPDLRDDPDPRPDINLEAAASLRTRLITLISAAGGLRARLGGAPTATDIADAVRWGLVADPVAAVAALTERIAAATKAATGDTARLERWLRLLSDASGSDLLLVAGVPPMLRVNGRLRPLAEGPLDGVDVEETVVPALPPHARRQYRTARIADGSFRLAGAGRFRINLHRERGRAAAAIRLLPQRIPRLDTLGLPPAVALLAELPRGLVLIGGATGSGKTTTLAALVDEINRRESRHVVTIEDPIEYEHPHQRSVIEQVEIGIDAPDFPTALRPTSS